MVEWEMLATMPLRITSARMSGTNRRDRGTSRVAGSSQAIALTSTSTCGEKNGGSAVVYAPLVEFGAGANLLDRRSFA